MLIGNATLDTGVVNAFLDAPEIKKASVMQFQDDSSINNSTHLMTMFSVTFLRLAMVLLTISYLFLWIVSAILLYGYSRRLGKSTTYWMVIFLPPVFLLLGMFPSLLGISNANFSFIERDTDLFRILATLAIIVGGLLFGVSFFVLARSMRQVRQGAIADYLNIANYCIAPTTTTNSCKYLIDSLSTDWKCYMFSFSIGVLCILCRHIFISNLNI